MVKVSQAHGQMSAIVSAGNVTRVAYLDTLVHCPPPTSIEASVTTCAFSEVVITPVWEQSVSSLKYIRLISFKLSVAEPDPP